LGSLILKIKNNNSKAVLVILFVISVAANLYFYSLYKKSNDKLLISEEKLKESEIEYSKLKKDFKELENSKIKYYPKHVYDEDYNDGYEAGLEDGNENGYEEGFSEGKEEGITESENYREYNEDY